MERIQLAASSFEHKGTAAFACWTNVRLLDFFETQEKDAAHRFLRVEAVKIILHERMSQRMGKQIRVNEVPKISSQESVEIAKITLRSEARFWVEHESASRFLVRSRERFLSKWRRRKILRFSHFFEVEQFRCIDFSQRVS